MNAHPSQCAFSFTPTQRDPALLAVADCSYAWKRYTAALGERDDPEAPDETRDLFDARAAEALYDWEAAWRCVLHVTPTTVAGAVALAAFLAAHNDETGGDETARETLSALAVSLKHFSEAA